MICSGGADPSRVATYAGPKNGATQLANVAAFYALEPVPTSTGAESVKSRLLRAESEASRKYVIPALVPVLTSSAQWAAATPYAVGDIVPLGNRVLTNIKAGTSGATAPTGTGPYILDGTTVIWSELGYLAPVAYANNATIYSGQIFCNAGAAFRATSNGAFAASGTGPAYGVSGTDGTVAYVFAGPQALPIVGLGFAYANGLAVLANQIFYNGTTGVFRATSAGAFAASGSGPTAGASGTDGTVSYVSIGQQALPVASLTSQVTATEVDTKFSVIGGTYNFWAGGGRFGVDSTSYDGLDYVSGNLNGPGGGGSVYTVTDEPLVDFNFYSAGPYSVWADGQYVALIVPASQMTWHNSVNFSDMPDARKTRTLRFEVPSSLQIMGFRATALGLFKPYTPQVNIRSGLVGDSLTEGGAIFVLSYGVRLGHLLGIEDFRVSGVGGTGILQTQGPRPNYQGRFAVDVLARSLDLLILQNSLNDQAPISAAGGSGAAIFRAAHDSLLAQAAAAGIQSIVIGPWDGSTTIAGAAVIIQAQSKDSAAAFGVPFIDWSTLVSKGATTDQGYVGSTGGAPTTTAMLNVTWDHTHPTPFGQGLRSSYLGPQIRNAYGKL